MLEKLLTVRKTLPNDAAAAALVGRVDRPGLGPSVVRVNPDATVTDITAAFPTVSQLCNQPDPAAALRAAEGEDIGPLADILKARQLLAPVDLQTVKAAGVTFPVSMIERMIEGHGLDQSAGLRVVVGSGPHPLGRLVERGAAVGRSHRTLSMWRLTTCSNNSWRPERGVGSSPSTSTLPDRSTMVCDPSRIRAPSGPSQAA